MTANELAYEIIKCFGSAEVSTTTLDTFVSALAARIGVPIAIDIVEAAKIKIQNIHNRTRKDKNDLVLT